MNVLLIDNSSLHVNELKAELESYASHIEIKRFNQIDYSQIKNVDLVVLSGNSGIPYMSEKEAFDRETKFIHDTKIPIIGICYGLKLIVYAFGGTAENLVTPEHGVLDIEVINNDPIFRGKKLIQVYEAHKSVILPEELGPELIPLAKSRDGIEIVKHPDKPVYGFQFHPEVHKDKNEGYELLKNAILELIKSTENQL